MEKARISPPSRTWLDSQEDWTWHSRLSGQMALHLLDMSTV